MAKRRMAPRYNLESPVHGVRWSTDGDFWGTGNGSCGYPIAWSLICAAFLIYSAVRLIWALWHA